MPDLDDQFSQTPLYRAQHSDRYARQSAIKEIEKSTGRRLIVYETNGAVPIDGEDVPPFADLLDKLPPGVELDLMIHSGGGNIDAAEKIVFMCRKKASGFRVIAPEYAKSAATLIALASDQVIMGITSELGPIDTQLTGPGPGGAHYQTSAQTFLEEFERIKEEVRATGELSAVYFPVLEGISPGFLGMCRHARQRAEGFARKWLREHMKKGDPEAADRIAADLSDVNKWHSHGSVVDAEEARRIGIEVLELTEADGLWRRVWYLHCCYRVLFARTTVTRIFESDTVSLPFA